MTAKFICDDCKSKALVINKSMELGPDDQSDERSLQTISCLTCGFQGIALYEESRRGRGESWRHYGFKVTVSVYESILEAINCNNVAIDIGIIKNIECFPLMFQL